MKLFFGFLDLQILRVVWEEVKKDVWDLSLNDQSENGKEHLTSSPDQLASEAVVWEQEMGKGGKRRSWEAPGRKFYFQKIPPLKIPSSPSTLRVGCASLHKLHVKTHRTSVPQPYADRAWQSPWDRS